MSYDSHRTARLCKQKWEIAEQGKEIKRINDVLKEIAFHDEGWAGERAQRYLDDAPIETPTIN